MSFSDPAAIVLNGVTKNFVRVNTDGYSSEYKLRSADDELRLNVRNSQYSDKKRAGQKVDRHNVEIIWEVFPVAPATRSVIRKAYIVFENDVGDTLTDPQHLADALAAFLTASSDANIIKALNWES